MSKKILPSIAASAILLFPLCYNPLPASAMTGEEFVKLLGVFSRYGEDLQKTFPGNTAPAPEPEAPTPTESDTTEEEGES
jgi:hypothetical protein